jgi:hypothetical protein
MIRRPRPTAHLTGLIPRQASRLRCRRPEPKTVGERWLARPASGAGRLTPLRAAGCHRAPAACHRFRHVAVTPGGPVLRVGGAALPLCWCP